jgi:hypothetical protein
MPGPARLLVLVVSILCAHATHAAWVVDERGACVEEWRSGDLLRGPMAIANVPLVPFRSAVGGWQLAREDKTPGLQRKFMLPAMLTLGGGVMGTAEAVLWLGTGLADTLTGGAFSIAPDEATTLSVSPRRPTLIADTRPPATDPCGRATSR